MRIKTIINQHRRDFTASFECEHCGYTLKRSGYDDAHFHNTVVPAMACPECKLCAPDTYRPRSPKYGEGETV